MTIDHGQTRLEAIPLDVQGLGRYEQLAGRMPGLLEELRACQPLGARGPISTAAGIYLLSEALVPLYVGQTRTLRRRLRKHGGATSRENEASLPSCWPEGSPSSIRTSI